MKFLKKRINKTRSASEWFIMSKTEKPQPDKEEEEGFCDSCECNPCDCHWGLDE